MELSGKHIVVVGLGQSGRAAARLLERRGARVTVNDRRVRADLPGLAELEALGIEVVAGGHPASLLRAADCVVVSPGVPPLAELGEAEAAGVPVVGEVELASWFIEGTVIGVTGTNGKSTVTSLIGKMCELTGRPLFVGGNLGTPLIQVVGSEAAGPDGLVVVELSSFQLERVDRLRVHVAGLLNVTDDHLDRYPSFDAYAAAKQNIFRGQQPEDFAVVHADDARCVELAAISRAPVMTFGGEDSDMCVRDGCIVDREGSVRVPLAALQLTGAHNVDNACAAALMARLAGVPRSAVGATLSSFSGLPHRMQLVSEVDGVRYYDDSKATNVGAAVASLAGLTSARGRVVLIAGGKDKGGSYAPLVTALSPRARGAVLIGEAAPLLREALHGVSYPVVAAGSMSDAVHQAARLARPGDAVLLAPACSSFDMFASYAERGERFVEAVKALRGRDSWV